MNLDSLLRQYENGRLSRRDWLGAFAVLVAAPATATTAHAAQAGATTGSINHVCFDMGKFDADAVLKQLTGRGIKANIRLHGDTKELYFTDPGGIRVQLRDVNYKGWTGPLGDQDPQ